MLHQPELGLGDTELGDVDAGHRQLDPGADLIGDCGLVEAREDPRRDAVGGHELDPDLAAHQLEAHEAGDEPHRARGGHRGISGLEALAVRRREDAGRPAPVPPARRIRGLAHGRGPDHRPGVGRAGGGSRPLPHGRVPEQVDGPARVLTWGNADQRPVGRDVEGPAQVGEVGAARVQPELDQVPDGDPGRVRHGDDLGVRIRGDDGRQEPARATEVEAHPLELPVHAHRSSPARRILQGEVVPRPRRDPPDRPGHGGTGPIYHGPPRQHDRRLAHHAAVALDGRQVLGQHYLEAFRVRPDLLQEIDQVLAGPKPPEPELEAGELGEGPERPRAGSTRHSSRPAARWTRLSRRPPR